jgi:transglutaminase-like putative cysteine protease
MTSLIDQKYAEWTAGLDAVRARIALFEKVRDIPYAYPASRDPEEVLRSGCGTCSGKHYLLAELYRRLGLRVRNMICSHRFNESPLPFPENMQSMLRKDEIVDMHDYLQIELNGDWIDVDATWERGLREFGFPVNEDWDGEKPMLLSVVADENVVVDGPEAARSKEEMLAKLSPRQRALRKQFLDALNQWMLEIAPEIERGG